MEEQHQTNQDIVLRNKALLRWSVNVHVTRALWQLYQVLSRSQYNLTLSLLSSHWGSASLLFSDSCIIHPWHLHMYHRGLPKEVNSFCNKFAYYLYVIIPRLEIIVEYSSHVNMKWSVKAICILLVRYGPTVCLHNCTHASTSTDYADKFM